MDWLAWLAWLAVPVGAALIGISLLDIGLTVLHIQAESPFSVRLNRAVWGVVRRVSGVLPVESRGRLLAWGFPIMVSTTIAFWIAVFVSGFALLYLPLMRAPRA